MQIPERVKRTIENHKPELIGAAIAVAGMAVGYAIKKSIDGNSQLLVTRRDLVQLKERGGKFIFETALGEYELRASKY